MRMKRDITLLVAAVLALGIFVIDAFTPLNGAIAVLQIAVILLVAPVGQRALLMCGAACAGLTVASFAIGHGLGGWNGALVRLIVSLVAQAITVVLSLRDRSTRRSLDEQARILDLSHDTVIIRDRTDRIIDWNRGAETLYGWTRDEAIGCVCADLLQSHIPDGKADLALCREGKWAGHIERTCRDGRRLTLASRWLVRTDAAGEPIGVIESSIDLTVQIASEAERNQARMQLSHLSAELAHAAGVATLGQMSASIVHEVNQPLTAIINYGNSTRRWLNQPEPDMAEVRQCIDRIIASGQRPADVIRRVRDMARKVPARPEALDLADLTAQVLALLETEARRGKVRLTQALAPGLPRVVGDRVQVQQVLVNLVMNAIQAARPDGSAEVKIMAEPTGAGQLAVTVCDNGPGVPADAMGRLFEAFYSTKADGMGIGLSICRSLVETLGGTLTAQNGVPHGASFTFTLPLAGDGCAGTHEALR